MQAVIHRSTPCGCCAACPQAMEPFFSVVLSSMFLGDKPTWAVMLSLLPIVGGVAMASMAEVRGGGVLVEMNQGLLLQLAIMKI